MKKSNVELTESELGTVLAALRLFQRSGFDSYLNQPTWMRGITTNEGESVSLNAEHIDRLCERLNFGT